MQVTLTRLLTQAIARHSDRVALQVGNVTWTYKELDSSSAALANSFADLGISQGDRVALYLKNSSEYVIADLALIKIGAVKVPLNEYQSARDVSYILQDTHATTIIAHQSLLNSLASSSDLQISVSNIICVPEDAHDAPLLACHWWQDLVSDRTFNAVECSPEDPALITYTGGTTGKPKGVVQSQGSLGINLCAHIMAGEIAADDVMLLSTPLPHSAGYHLQACLLQGGKVVLQHRFDPLEFYAEVTAQRVTWTFLVPTMIYRLLDSAGTQQHDHESLATIVYGAAPMSTERLKQAIDTFGLCFIQLYGQTECPNYITALTKDDHRDPNLHESCGKAVPFVDLATTAENRRDIGEVIVRSPYLLSEYLNNPDATRSTLVNGWLHTGDIGYINNDGYLFLKDRAKDMLISGGMNVYTIEVEQVLKRHPAILDAAVIGKTDEDWGERVHAIAVLKEDQDISTDALIDFCKSELSKYKVPKSIEFRSALPLTTYGKTDKKALRNETNNNGENR